MGAGEAVKLREGFPLKIANTDCGLHADRYTRGAEGGRQMLAGGGVLKQLARSHGSHGSRAQRGCPLVGAGLILPGREPEKKGTGGYSRWFWKWKDEGVSVG